MYTTFAMYYTGLTRFKLAKFNAVQLRGFMYNDFEGVRHV